MSLTALFVGLIEIVAYKANQLYLVSAFEWARLNERAAFLFDNAVLIGIVLLLLSSTSEALSRIRVPPPTWRVRQELISTLIALNLLPRDQTKWHGMLWVAPLGHYDFKTKRYTLLFDIRNPKATEKRFEKIGGGIAGFAHSQDVAIEHARIKRMGNRRECMRLIVWYGQSPFSSNEQYGSPW